MDEVTAPTSSDNGRWLALFSASVIGLVLALGVDDLPFAPTSGPLALLAEVLHLGVLGTILYLVGRLGATVVAHGQ